VVRKPNGPDSDLSVSGPSAVYTIGHSTRSIEEFLALLRREEIAVLADIRTFPSSKRYPHFNAASLGASLLDAAIEYRHFPQLGGRRTPRKDSKNTLWRNAGFRGYADYMETDEFRSALADLVSLSRKKRTAIMCAEAVPWRCHRNLVSDALVAGGIPVRHILDAKVTNHTLTPFARVEDGSVSYHAENPHPDLFGETEKS
jgi:uncharacterized protein (DUF488 family)